MMAKRKQSPEKPLPATAANPADVPSLPSTRARSLITIGLIVHAFLLMVSYGATVEPSDLQTRLKIFFSWYLNPLHLNVDDRPIFLLHQDDDAAAIEFQVRVLPTDPGDDPSSDAGWRPVPRAGWVGGEQRKRYQRWARTTARLAAQQEPGLAGALARRAVIDDDARLIRLALLHNRLTDQIPGFERELYRAAIVREADAVRFVRLSEPRENAVAREAARDEAARETKDRRGETGNDESERASEVPQSPPTESVE